MASITMPLPTGMDQPNGYLTIEEVAKRLRCTVKTVRKFVYYQGLRSYRIGNRLLFKLNEVDAWADAHSIIPLDQ